MMLSQSNSAKPMAGSFRVPLGSEMSTQAMQEDRRTAGSTSTSPSSRTLSEAPETAVEYISSSSLAGKRIIICEDEGVTQMQLRRALTRAGLNVIGTAFNGQEGVEMALREDPDIVLMDIRMPVMDGLEAARRIMASRPVCVVMLTAFSDSDVQLRARELGASGYIVKPITSDVLMPLLQEAYTRFQSSSPSS
jgi:CheY-like chemotaxis protein